MTVAKSFKQLIPSVIFLMMLASSCKVTFITGYDQVLDQTVTEIKKDFNRHFVKLSRVIQDNNPNNQKFDLFQDYYDNLEADLITLRGRTKFLGGRSDIVKKQIDNLENIFRTFIILHRSGMPDRQGDDRRDIRDNINSALDAITILQESLKSTGKPNT